MLSGKSGEWRLCNPDSSTISSHMEEKETPNGFSDWEHLLSSSTPSPPATTIHTSVDPFLSIFPPVNHEGLPAASPLDDSHHHYPSSTTNESPVATASFQSHSRFFPSDSRAGDPSNRQRSLNSHSPSPISLVIRWIGIVFQLLKFKTLSFFTSVRSRISESSVSIGGLTTGASLMMLGVWIWWRRRPRRPRGSGDDTIERLNLLIREKDEKIIELLNQVAQLNKLLLARYRVPVVREC